MEERAMAGVSHNSLIVSLEKRFDYASARAVAPELLAAAGLEQQAKYDDAAVAKLIAACAAVIGNGSERVEAALGGGEVASAPAPDKAPAVEEPAAEESVEEPSEEEIAALSEAAEEEPAAEEPAAEEPAAEEPAAEEPAAEKPAEDKPAAKKPAAKKPATKKPAAKKPAKKAKK
jgi:hypothetical protein